MTYRLWRRGSLGALATTALVVACGSDGDGGTTIGKASSASEFRTSLCDLLQPCCKNLSKTYDQLKCTEFYGRTLGPTAAYDAAKGQACLDRVRAAASSFCGGRVDDDEACKPVLAGQVYLRAKEGEACAGDRKDESDPPNVEDRSATVGICWSSDGLYCNVTAKTCSKRIAEGGACDPLAANACAAGFHCDPDAKTCIAPLADGAACKLSASTPNPCSPSSYCDSSKQACVPAKASGQYCQVQAECGVLVCQNEACTASPAKVTSSVIACN